MLINYTYLVPVLYFDILSLAGRIIDPSEWTLGQTIINIIIIITFFLIVIMMGSDIIKKLFTIFPQKYPSKEISEAEIEKALSEQQSIFIEARYISGIKSVQLFKEGVMLTFELHLDEFRTSVEHNDFVFTKSFSCSRILYADVVELAKLRPYDSIRATALYFVIDHLDLKGEKQRIICEKPSPYEGNYALFMAVLERRCPNFAAANKVAAALEPSQHKDS